MSGRGSVDWQWLTRKHGREGDIHAVFSKLPRVGDCGRQKKGGENHNAHKKIPHDTY